MNCYYIDSYHYCAKEDALKEKFYREHEDTKKEQQKTKEFIDKMEDFIKKTSGEKLLRFFHGYDCVEGKIHYREGIGYISINNFDRDEIIVYGYGMTLEEAFLRATIDFEFYYRENYEWSNRQELNKQFSERFLNGAYTEHDYHGPFFFIELALQDFRAYYGDNIPEEIMEHYRNHLNEVGLENFEYSYETNRLEKLEPTQKLVLKPNEEKKD